MNLLLASLLFNGGGIFAVFKGRKGIRGRYLTNHVGSQIFTGVSGVEGEWAVRGGKFLVVAGFLMSGVGTLMFFGTLLSMLMSPSLMGRLSFSRSRNPSTPSVEAMEEIIANERMAGSGPVMRDNSAGSSLSGILDRAEPQGRLQPRNTTGDGNASDSNTPMSGDPIANDPDFMPVDSVDSDSLEEQAEAMRREAEEEFERTRQAIERQRLEQQQRNDFRANNSFKPSDTSSGFDSSPAGSGDVVLPVPEKPFPTIRFDTSRVERSQPIGSPLAEGIFEDSIQDGRLVVGLLVRQNKLFGGAIQSTQPIYQSGSNYELGQSIGDDSGKPTVLLAPPGFTVSGLGIHRGTQVMSIQLAFMQVGDSGKLLTKTLQSSPVVGNVFGQQVTVHGDGKPIVSLYGSFDQDKLMAVGIVASPRVRIEKSSGPRTWSTADGKFSVEAELISQSVDTVSLRKEDGKTISVKKALLSSADIEYLTNQE